MICHIVITPVLTLTQGGFFGLVKGREAGYFARATKTPVIHSELNQMSL